MPEKVTRQEKIISLAIEKARKAKEELSAKQRKNIEPTQILEIDTDPEVEKIKRPKVQDASKITNQTQKKEGYGLAGESLKKQDKPKRMVSYKNTTKDVRSADSYLSPYQRLKARQDDIKNKQEWVGMPNFGRGKNIFGLARRLDSLIKQALRRNIKSPRLFELEEMQDIVKQMEEPVNLMAKAIEEELKKVADRKNK